MLEKVRQSSIPIAWFLSVILVIWGMTSSQTASAEITSCSIDEKEHLLQMDVSNLQRKDIMIIGLSTEGTGVEIYYDDNDKISFIKSTSFGETGKSILKYYFDVNVDETYIVEIIDYNYLLPIYESSDVKIASTISSLFLVCDGWPASYPNGSDLWGAYQSASEILKTIRDHL